MDVRQAQDDFELRIRGILRHGTHDQSSHGRKGPRGIAKAAVKKAAQAVTAAGKPAKAAKKAAAKPGKPKLAAGANAAAYRRGRDITGTDLSAIATIHTRSNSNSGDLALVEIRERQGFNGPPRLASRAELDRAVADGEVTETFRGFNGDGAAAYAEQYRTGEQYPGSGVYGNGTYVANDRSQAELFAGRWEPGSDVGEVMRLGLRTDAKVVSIAKLQAEMKAWQRRNAATKARLDDLDQQMRKAAERADTTEERIAVYADYAARKAAAAGPEYLLSQDAGRFAALRGYDAIDLPDAQGGPQMIILNRTAVMVEQP